MSKRSIDRVYFAAALGAICAIALLVGIRRGIDYEEATYYIPSYRASADAWPGVASAYPAPMPPAGLWTHGLVWRATDGSVSASRLLNFSLFLVTACIAWLHARRTLPEGRRGDWTMLALCHPTVATSAFLLKPNAFALAWGCAGVAVWLGGASARRGGRDALGSVFLTVGTFSNQMVSALAAHGSADVVLLGRDPWPSRLLRATVRALPLLALFGLFVAWGGLTAPGFRDHDIEREVGPAFRPGQLFIGLIVTSAWIFPWTGLRRGAWPLALLAWPLCSLGVHATGMLSENNWNGPFMTGAVRSLVEEATRGAYVPTVALTGALAALGAALVVDGARRGGVWRSFALLFAVYAAMMNFVPYHYEQYYLIFVVGSLFVLADAPDLPPGATFRILRALAAAYGLAYAFLEASYAGGP